MNMELLKTVANVTRVIRDVRISEEGLYLYESEFYGRANEHLFLECWFVLMDLIYSLVRDFFFYLF